MELSERIKLYRQKAHLSQEKLAEFMGVSRQAVTKWESGQSVPTTENLFRLAELFEISVDQLVADQESSLSVAEQVLELHQAEDAKKKAQRRAEICSRLLHSAGILLFFGLLFLLGKVVFQQWRGGPILGWLLGTDPQNHSYLFGWLLKRGLYLTSSILCVVPVWFGRRRTGWMGLLGFSLGLFLGEFCGKNPAGAAWGLTHYGWLIWGGSFLVSLIMGWILERFSQDSIHWKNRKFQIFLAIYTLAMAAVILLTRMGMAG